MAKRMDGWMDGHMRRGYTGISANRGHTARGTLVGIPKYTTVVQNLIRLCMYGNTCCTAGTGPYFLRPRRRGGVLGSKYLGVNCSQFCGKSGSFVSASDLQLWQPLDACATNVLRRFFLIRGRFSRYETPLCLPNPRTREVRTGAFARAASHYTRLPAAALLSQQGVRR